MAVDGQRGTPRKFSNLIAAHACAEQPPAKGCRAAEPATVTVVRDGRERTFEITPVYDPEAPIPGSDRTGRTRVGFAYAAGPRETLPLGESLEVAVDRFWFVTKATL